MSRLGYPPPLQGAKCGGTAASAPSQVPVEEFHDDGVGILRFG